VHGIVAYICDLTKPCDDPNPDFGVMMSKVLLVILILQFIVYSIYFVHELKNFLDR
jgi:hypothetical protein